MRRCQSNAWSDCQVKAHLGTPPSLPRNIYRSPRPSRCFNHLHRRTRQRAPRRQLHGTARGIAQRETTRTLKAPILTPRMASQQFVATTDLRMDHQSHRIGANHRLGQSPVHGLRHGLAQDRVAQSARHRRRILRMDRGYSNRGRIRGTRVNPARPITGTEN